MTSIEGKLRLREGKEFDPGHTALVTETGLTCGSSGFPDNFGTGWSGSGGWEETGEREGKEGVGGLGTGRQRYVGPSCLLIRDPSAIPKGYFIKM